MRTAQIALVLLMISATSATAQDPLATPTDHEIAATELVDLLRLEAVTQSTIDMMVKSMTAQDPALAQIQDLFVDFFKEFMSWQDLRPEYVRLYMEAFTVSEIHELIAFYGTPVGRKTVEVTPWLMSEGSEVGQRMVQPHIPELERRIRARIGGAG